MPRERRREALAKIRTAGDLRRLAEQLDEQRKIYVLEEKVKGMSSRTEIVHRIKQGCYDTVHFFCKATNEWLGHCFFEDVPFADCSDS
ncbi:MAG: hypothetical protein UY41_C0038G0001 [Candidatus Moranbacteria bacterium GW2011_GWE1_49_15]|nr:MAG: hypothetical protein UY41_C0038G0001 [Candidatus Moranbacteria bacterium GW2011_GWE1_49_15]HBP00937.1 hypothetical protein [Candidatus Moranbacteria bacterium]